MNKRYLWCFAAVLLAFLIAVPGIAAAEDNTYTNISASTAKEMLKNKDVWLIDVRVENEFNAAHIKGATLIPVKKLGKTEPYFLEEVFMAEVEKNGIMPEDKPVIVYCLSGSRSMNASQYLANNGYTVYNLQYGIQEWVDVGYPVVSTFVDVSGVVDCVKNVLNAQINRVFVLLEKGCDQEAKDQLNKTNCTINKTEEINKISHDQAIYLKNETGFIRQMII
ncbi:Thiosulfate sulfurtransferase GlpE [bioreactor metagenome]|uniref:Thiosulfate sulfurtransferase GlpE n=1 Tax=bioreactor metagenome TaxID=1076179 RepID=A0A645AEQ0_9ZZZZ